MAAIFKTSQQDGLNHSLQSLTANKNLLKIMVRKKTLNFSGHRRNVYLQAIDIKT